MPYPLLRLLLLLCLPLLTLACEKEPLDLLDELVPATQEGANTLGCLIDGEVFYNRGGSIGVPDITSSYGTVGNKRLSIAAFDISTSGSVDREAILLYFENFQVGGYRPLIPYKVIDIRASGVSEEYEIYLQHSFEFIITNYDAINRIASGRFSFTAINKSNGLLKIITDGRFDVKYQ